jgi:hypothetical protein
LRFLDKASAVGKPARIAFLDTDPCISLHACCLQNNMEHVGNLYLGDFFFFTAQVQERDFIPVLVDTESIPLSYSFLPSVESGSGKRLIKTPLAAREPLFPPLQLQVPLLSYIPIKHWTQLLFANFIWGIHCQARQLDIVSENRSAMLKKIISYLSKHRGPIRVGKDCQIDPTAAIIGPTTIGDGVIIGPNVTCSGMYWGSRFT